MDSGCKLSKWWKTKSCKDAIKRAKARKRASLQKFLKAHREKKAAQQREIENWTTVT